MGNKSLSSPSKIRADSNKRKFKSDKKEKLFSDEKPFEKFENTSIYGYRLFTDPEEREYYLNCPKCSKLNLDNGINRTIICKKCQFEFDVENNENDLEITKKDEIKKKRIMEINMDEKAIVRLKSLVLIVNIDTLFSNFLLSENKPDFELIIKKILLPYFKMKSRILHNNELFKIGEIMFKVSGLSPGKTGLICSKTYIQLNKFFTTNVEMSRVLLLTTRKYDNFNQESLKKEFFDTGEKVHIIIKNDVFEMKNYEFYVRNCEPESGVIGQNTQLTIENREITQITRIKLSVIKNNIPQFRNSEEKKNYEEFILKEYFQPYFLSGVRKYLERGDVVQIENIEFFVLNCTPDHGFISKETDLIFKFGLTKEECLERIRNSDNQYVMNLNRIQDRLSNTFINNELLFTNPSQDLSNINNFNQIRDFIMSSMRNAYGSTIMGDSRNYLEFDDKLKIETIKNNLPVFTVTDEYLNFIKQSKSEEIMKKCIICMGEFENNDNLRTLPCFHLFHAHCVDEWLLNNSNCPVCKSTVEI